MDVVIPCLVVIILSFFPEIMEFLNGYSWSMRDLVPRKVHYCRMTAAVAELPRVNGQHRNQALADARRARAVELRIAGVTYEGIAAELGYANRGTVYRVVSEALKKQTVEAVEQLRSLEVERLDTLQHAVWQRAMN